MTRHHRRVTAALLTVALAMVAGGCGNRTQSHPVRLDQRQVPFGLLRPPTSTVPPTTLPVRKYPFVVYFQGVDGIVPAIRTVGARPDPAAVGKALLAGPTGEEVQVGMRTAIPPLAIGSIGKIVRHTVAVDLRRPLIDVSGAEQKVAVAQIVLSLTFLDGVNHVRFLLDGSPVSVPRGNGTVTRAAVTRADYLKVPKL
ncbi:MAG: hypothetical protein JWL83_541 [Actinomycetia bacterium]|nr:hypothetical protein [Actinomycetes bacterium]